MRVTSDAALAPLDALVDPGVPEAVATTLDGDEEDVHLHRFERGFESYRLVVGDQRVLVAMEDQGRRVVG